MARRFSLKPLIIVLSVLSLVSLVVCLGLGPASISPTEVCQIVGSHIPGIRGKIAGMDVNWTEVQDGIIMTVRLPRVILGFFVGCSLAFSGAAMQVLVKNEIADPYILGVSSGAAAFSAIGIVTGLFSFLGVYQNAANGLIGAMLALIIAFLYSLEKGKVNVEHLLLGGVAIAMFGKALVKVIALMNVQAFLHNNTAFWTQGGLGGTRWEYLKWPVLLILVCFVFLYNQYRSLNAFLLGEETAGTLGVNVTLMEKVLVLTTSVMIGITVSVSGGIGFVGLVAPHVARMFVGGDNSRVFPVAALLGGLFVLWCDAAARMLLAPEELSVGILTAIIGGPVFIYLLKKKPYYGK
ncbi:MAG: iron ABC transporter permease [Firmicutes bacterium]|nr:iron ABC transporter permease [Bacillota bacterium]